MRLKCDALGFVYLVKHILLHFHHSNPSNECDIGVRWRRSEQSSGSAKNANEEWSSGFGYKESDNFMQFGRAEHSSLAPVCHSLNRFQFVTMDLELGLVSAFFFSYFVNFFGVSARHEHFLPLLLSGGNKCQRARKEIRVEVGSKLHFVKHTTSPALFLLKRVERRVSQRAALVFRILCRSTHESCWFVRSSDS